MCTETAGKEEKVTTQIETLRDKSMKLDIDNKNLYLNGQRIYGKASWQLKYPASAGAEGKAESEQYSHMSYSEESIGMLTLNLFVSVGKIDKTALDNKAVQEDSEEEPREKCKNKDDIEKKILTTESKVGVVVSIAVSAIVALVTSLVLMK